MVSTSVIIFASGLALKSSLSALIDFLIVGYQSTMEMNTYKRGQACQAKTQRHLVYLFPRSFRRPKSFFPLVFSSVLCIICLVFEFFVAHLARSSFPRDDFFKSTPGVMDSNAESGPGPETCGLLHFRCRLCQLGLLRQRPGHLSTGWAWPKLGVIRFER